MDKEKKFAEVLQNNSFREDLKTANTREEVQSTFSKYGVDLNREEVDEFLRIGLEESKNGEVNISELEEVTGGVGPVTAWMILTTSYAIIKDVSKHAWNAGKKFAQWESGLRSH